MSSFLVSNNSRIFNRSQASVRRYALFDEHSTDSTDGVYSLYVHAAISGYRVDRELTS